MDARVLSILLSIVIIVVCVIAVGLKELYYSRCPKTYIYLAIVRSGRGNVLINGSEFSGIASSSPFVAVLRAVPRENWAFKYWVINNSITSKDNPLVFRISANTSVTAVFKRLRCVLKVNGPRGYLVTVNGTSKRIPFAIETWCGASLTLEASSEVPLNTTYRLRFTSWLTPSGNVASRNLTLILEGNESLILNATVAPSTSSCRGVLVESDVSGAAILAGDKRLCLPACLPLPAEFEGEWYVPLNETHGYWLAWYWVEFANGTRYWWSYGLNGSKLKIDQPANVTLHYVLGLRELPYVARVWVMPEDAWRVEKGICVYRVENGSIHVGYKEGAPYFLCILMLELPREAGLVAIDLVPDDRRTYSSKVGVVELNGWYLFDVPTRTFRYRGPHSLLLNVTCWLSIWRALTENVTIPSRVLTNEQESNLSRFWEAIDAGLSFRYCPAFWLYDEESRLVDWWYNHRGLSATTLIDLDYYEKTGLLKLAVLPNTGRVGLYIDFGRAVRGWGSGRIAVRGVAP